MHLASLARVRIFALLAVIALAAAGCATDTATTSGKGVAATTTSAPESEVDHHMDEGSGDHNMGDMEGALSPDDCDMTRDAEDKGFCAAEVWAQGEHGIDKGGVDDLDAETQATLDDELATAREAALRYPTVADAKAGGFTQAGGMSPLTASHYVKMMSMGGFDPANPPTLLYSGVEDDDVIVGLMYLAQDNGGGPPEGFTGDADPWHAHTGVCIRYGAGGIESLAPASGITEEECATREGNYMGLTTYMLHVWVVPGWESPQGVFSAYNTKIACPNGEYFMNELDVCIDTEATDELSTADEVRS